MDNATTANSNEGAQQHQRDMSTTAAAQSNVPTSATSVEESTAARASSTEFTSSINEDSSDSPQSKATSPNTGRRKKTWFPALQDQYQEVCKSIIRPPRDYYELEHLGPQVFRIRQKIFVRRDLILYNNKAQELQCSHFSPHPRYRKHAEMPCVVYLHGNCSSRLEALGILHVLLPLNVTVFSFDFAGSGLSDGEYVSLGWHEREDLSAVVDHLRSSKEVSTIGLWGRSMGAVTALLHCHRDPSIACIVLDSPFSSLRKLATELTEFFVGWKLPRFLVNMVLNLIRSTIQQKAEFDINDLEPIKYVSSTHMPAMFIAGKNDRFIQPHHSQDLQQAYNGEAIVHNIDGDHNTIRPAHILNEVAMFFYERLQYEYCTQSLQDACNDAAADMSASHNVTTVHSEDSQCLSPERNHNLNINNVMVPPAGHSPRDRAAVVGGSTAATSGGRGNSNIQGLLNNHSNSSTTANSYSTSFSDATGSAAAAGAVHGQLARSQTDGRVIRNTNYGGDESVAQSNLTVDTACATGATGYSSKSKFFWNWFSNKRHISSNKAAPLTHRELGNSRQSISGDNECSDNVLLQRRASASLYDNARQQQVLLANTHRANANPHVDTSSSIGDDASNSRRVVIGDQRNGEVRLLAGAAANKNSLEEVLLRSGAQNTSVYGQQPRDRSGNTDSVNVISAKEWETDGDMHHLLGEGMSSPELSNDETDRGLSVVVSPDTSAERHERSNRKAAAAEIAWKVDGASDGDQRIGMRRPDMDCRIDRALGFGAPP
eukprot:Lankesteria_metandrocarpae@DN4857_c0_g1_i1.p1